MRNIVHRLEDLPPLFSSMREALSRRGLRMEPADDAVARLMGWPDAESLEAGLTHGTAYPDKAPRTLEWEAAFREFLGDDSNQLNVPRLAWDVFGRHVPDSFLEHLGVACAAGVRVAKPTSTFGRGPLEQDPNRVPGKIHTSELGPHVLQMAYFRYASTDSASVAVREVEVQLKTPEGGIVGSLLLSLYLPNASADLSIAQVLREMEPIGDRHFYSFGNCLFHGSFLNEDLIIHDQPLAILHGWEILPSLRGHGLGYQMLEEALRIVRTHLPNLSVVAADTARAVESSGGVFTTRDEFGAQIIVSALRVQDQLHKLRTSERLPGFEFVAFDQVWFGTIASAISHLAPVDEDDEGQPPLW